MSQDCTSQISEARGQLEALPSVGTAQIGGWWKRWYPYIGHRRLMHLLLNFPNGPKGTPTTNDLSLLKPNDLTPAMRVALTPKAFGELESLGKPNIAPVKQWAKHWHNHLHRRELAKLLVLVGGTGRQSTPTLVQQDQADRSSTASRPKSERPYPRQFYDFSYTSGEIDSPAAFTIKVQGGLLLVTLNASHPAYPYLEPLLANQGAANNPSLKAADLLIRSWALHEAHTPTGLRKRALTDARSDWGRAIRNLLIRQYHS